MMLGRKKISLILFYFFWIVTGFFFWFFFYLLFGILDSKTWPFSTKSSAWINSTTNQRKKYVNLIWRWSVTLDILWIDWEYITFHIWYRWMQVWAKTIYLTFFNLIQDPNISITWHWPGWLIYWYTWEKKMTLTELSGQ